MPSHMGNWHHLPSIGDNHRKERVRNRERFVGSVNCSGFFLQALNRKGGQQCQRAVKSYHQAETRWLGSHDEFWPMARKWQSPAPLLGWDR